MKKIELVEAIYELVKEDVAVGKIGKKTHSAVLNAATEWGSDKTYNFVEALKYKEFDKAANKAKRQELVDILEWILDDMVVAANEGESVEEAPKEEKEVEKVIKKADVITDCLDCSEGAFGVVRSSCGECGSTNVNLLYLALEEDGGDLIYTSHYYVNEKGQICGIEDK